MSLSYCFIVDYKSKHFSQIIFFKQLQETYSGHFGEVFKTITTDNSSEFADLSELEKMADTLVYYAHSYKCYDKRNVEQHNGLIRRFIEQKERL